MMNHAITIYSIPSCAYCKMEKEFLIEHNIVFKEVDVAEDTQAAQRMIMKSGQSGVPVTEIDGKIIVGFDKSALKKLLDIA
ncbi:MAG: glutaredoxin domain-containing protein [Candidatus Diapherotrites archaeon]